MNYEQAKEASKYNPAGVMKVLEGLEWQCLHCQGKGYVVTGPAITDQYNCSLCEEGKIHYSHTPQVGEWCIFPSKDIRIITFIEEHGFYYAIADGLGYCGKDNYRDVTPILPWEEIERVLEEAGCWLEMNRPLSKYLKKNTMRVGCSVYQAGKPNYIVYAQGKSRQEAVMKAVIELGKEK